MASAAELRALGQYVSEPKPGRGRQLMDLLGQTWPARAAQEALSFATAPKRAYTGELQMWDPETGHVSDAAVEAGTGLAGLAMTGGVGGVARQAGETALGAGPIRAYHGSPHDFDRFDLSKIGTGEGAQAYGHGLYFAENEGVARSYRDALGGSLKHPDANAFAASRGWLRMGGGDPAKAASILDDAVKSGRLDAAPEELEAVKRMLLASEAPKTGKMYEVAIHADPERFLDWDAPLMRQHEDVRRAIENHPQARRLTGNDMVRGQLTAPTGEAIINRAAARTPEGARSLAEAGIPGIKYLDQGSRTAGDGSRNYVTFSDNIVEILRKYGVGSIAALPPAVQAAIQLQQEQAPQQ